MGLGLGTGKGWLVGWLMSNIGDAQQLETPNCIFFKIYFLFFSFLAGLTGKRACGREHILCERAVALSMICTRQTKPTARTVCGFASTPDCPAEQPRYGGSAIACARMLRMLRPMFSFPKLLFRRPLTVIAATVVACIIVARIIMVVVVFVVNAPLSMCLLFLLLFMHGGPGASKSATHPSEHGGLYQRAAN